MRPGTPGFVGDRLREARESRGLTGAGLAELIGVTRSSVSAYERGPQSPRPDVMQRICEVLNLPVAFFLRPTETDGDERVFWWRSMSAASKSARLRARHRSAWLHELFLALGNHLHFPEVDVPVFDLPQEPVQLSDDTIEEVASSVRASWGLGDGPISNVVWLLENHGVLVGRFDLLADSLDGFSTWIDDVPMVVVNADRNCVRSRFNAAHELGHLVLHRRVSPRKLGRPEDFSLIEDQAHRFARAFLLPRASFAEELYSPSLDAFRVLKERWRASIQTMIFRADDLGLVSAEKKTRLWQQLSKRRWRRSEPLDDELPAEEPRLLLQAFEELCGHDTDAAITTRDSVASYVPLRDLEAIAGLARGFLEFENPPLAKLIQFPTAVAENPELDAKRKRK